MSDFEVGVDWTTPQHGNSARADLEATIVELQEQLSKGKRKALLERLGMSQEESEMWREWKKIKQDARTQRRELAPDLLRAKGVPFTEHNHGAHLILDTHLGFVDFWPGTTKWKTRTFPPLEGYGIVRLLDVIKPEFA